MERSNQTRMLVVGLALAAPFVLLAAPVVLPAAPVVLPPAPGAAASELVPLGSHPASVEWPTEAWPEAELPGDLDRVAFDQAVEELFASKGRGGFANTRALLFVRGGRLVYERYADGFDRDSRFQSWSMAKSVTNAFVALVVGDGRLDLDMPAPVAEWQADADPRRVITLRELLQMRSGLANSDGFGQEDMVRSFVSRLLFGEGSTSPATFAADVDLAHRVGQRWAYSTGTSTLLAAIAGRQIGSGPEQTRDFLDARLFGPLGMRSAQPEFAASGEFVGGAFVHATARDWARFGYLYLRDGIWDGQRLLPAGWVDFSRTPSPAANNGIHGAHFWLNREPAEGQWKMLPGAPASVFAAEGANFQMVAMAPTLDLVAVRLGESQGVDYQELRDQFARAIAAFPEAVPPAPHGEVVP